ncbi:MAG: zinc-ribbon domain-containing protein [Nitrososphaeria archaeon]|nr:zinc-ribbon domain-containing protein [Nitrososphaeria archaeon]NIQ32961.1 zinc-ribbon domain-containing protein [Nitrososphaeria archaeon]
MHCSKCGAENKDDARYCSSCGESLYATRTPARKPDEWEKTCFGPARRGGLWASIWGGVFLIGLAILWYLDSINVLKWWPGILFLIGIMIVISGILSYASGERREGGSPAK